MIVGNGVRLNSNPGRSLAAASANTTVRSDWNERGALLNIYTSGADKKDGIPSGLRHPSVWLLPIKPGGLSSRFVIVGDGELVAAIAGGVNGSATLIGLGDLTAEGSKIAALAAALAGAGVISQADITAIVIAYITATLDGAGTTTADITALLYAAATLAGGGTVPTALLDAVGLPTATITGAGSVTVTGRADGSMAADISLGATLELSPDSIASSVKAALMGTELDGYTVQDIIKLTSAALLGKSSGGASSPVFRSLDDTANRVSGTVDGAGNRTASVLSP